jgi:hypothetical protein
MHAEVGMRLKAWRRSLALAFLGLVAAAAAARAETWNIDPAHTTVEFSVRHMMISNVKGQFEKVSGTIAASGNDPGSVQINAVIDATSINTRVEKRDAHLKSAAFLDVDKYPTITFKSTKVEPRRTQQMEGHRRPDAAWRDQTGRTRGRNRHTDQGPHRQDSRRGIGNHPDRSPGFRHSLE